MSNRHQELHLTPTGDVLPLHCLHSWLYATYKGAALYAC